MAPKVDSTRKAQIEVLRLANSFGAPRLRAVPARDCVDAAPARLPPHTHRPGTTLI